MNQKTAPHDPTQEADLIARLRDPRRSDGAFREVVRVYGPVLFHHLMRMIQQRADVDDVLQNTFIKAYRNMDRFRGDSKLLTWLYRIATNEALTHLRKAKRRQLKITTSEDVTQIATGLQADTDFDGGAAQAMLLGALTTLAEKQRAVFSMRYYDELPYQQISDITGTTVGSLKATYHQAAKKIEAYLKVHVNG